MTTSGAPNPFPRSGTLMVTDAGLETWLVFDRGVELPAFAAYPLVATGAGRALLAEYYQYYVSIAEAVGAGIVLETPTWRANPGWATTLGHDRATLAALIRKCVGVVDEVRRRSNTVQPFLVGGAVGPRGDGYRIDAVMDADQAAAYHAFQIDCMADTSVDVVTAITIGYADEAIGIARSAERAGLPVVISFTVETDGRLPSGMSLAEAIETTDHATGNYAHHYMINCAHPTHFDHVLDAGAPWVLRIGGLRANASMLSHAELDEMVELDDGDPNDLAARYLALRSLLPALQIVGGCCGTDHRHVEAIATAFCAAAHAASARLASNHCEPVVLD